MSEELNSNEYRTACRGCHGGCVHILTVDGGRVVKIRPDKDAPLNRGHACAKGMSIIEQLYHPDRLLYPQKRAGERGSGRWERITWEEALDTIAARLGALKGQYGAECISAITGTGRHLVPYLWRFTRALGTPNITSAGALICLGPRKNAGFSTSGAFNCVDYYGEAKPECLVVWGANPTTSGADGELQWYPRERAAAGARIIVIDPRKTELAERADLWLKIRPGTDGALALGILNVIIQEELYDREFVEKYSYGFDELRERCAEYDVGRVSKITWLPAKQILDAARMMAAAKPMSLEWGCAFEQSYNATQTCRAIYMIPAITGNYDVPGGFVESKKIVPTKRDPAPPDPRLINSYPYRSL
ncbi:MAG: molybdopterin-dependent oxidoreductase, partial [Oscillospiraceae bacterium]|nr:molybdopterin-dependent oxidoreductase [Oscillospiraceae bacterium]